MSQFRALFDKFRVVQEYLNVRDIEAALRKVNAKPEMIDSEQPSQVMQVLPPEVHIEEPETKEIKTSHESLRVKAVVEYDLPLTEVSVRLNEKPVHVTPQGKDIDGKRKRREMVFKIHLEKRENTLSITAFNVAGTSSKSEIRRITYVGKPDNGEPDKPVLFLLAVGISKYLAPAYHLDYAAEDALAVATIFDGQKGGIFRDVQYRLRRDREATRPQIINDRIWLEKQGTTKDIRLLFLAGHGDMDSQGNYYFLPYDYTPGTPVSVHGIPWDTLTGKLSKVGPAILMVDTCRAASIGFTERFDGLLKKMDSRLTGWVTFASSQANQVSIESDAWRHGAFTKALIDASSKEAVNVDRYIGGEKDGFISVPELGFWLEHAVSTLTQGRQIPSYQSPPSLSSSALRLFKLR